MVHPVDPAGQSRAAVAQRLVVIEDPVDGLVVDGLAGARVLEDGARGQVRGRELVAHEVIAALEQALEEIEVLVHLRREPSDALE